MCNAVSSRNRPRSKLEQQIRKARAKTAICSVGVNEMRCIYLHGLRAAFLSGPLIC